MALICYCVYRILCDICVLCRFMHVFFLISIIFTFLSTHFGTCIYSLNTTRLTVYTIRLLYWHILVLILIFHSSQSFPSQHHSLHEQSVSWIWTLTEAMDGCCAFFVVALVIPTIQVFHVQLPGHRLVLVPDAWPFDRYHCRYKNPINCQTHRTPNSMLSIAISRCTIQWNVQTFFRITRWQRFCAFVFNPRKYLHQKKLFRVPNTPQIQLSPL